MPQSPTVVTCRSASGERRSIVCLRAGSSVEMLSSRDRFLGAAVRLK